MFKILKKDKSTNARTGVLTTPHGKILTPAYIIVATHAEIKCLKPQDIAKTNTQVVISNTYHLWNFVPKQLPIYNFKFTNKNKKTFLLNKLGSNMPTMTDSGGFQVFSLGFGKENKVGKILKNGANLRMYANQQIKRQQIKITDKGVFFNIDGQRRFLNPEISMKLQEKLGADIIFAFDECTSPLDDFKYNKKALERTHRWAKKCLSLMANRQSQDKQQMLFGIVQGGRFKSLRVKSAKFIGSLPFDGFGIGGSFGQNEMLKTLKIVIPHLPEEKPRHLLGIGKIQDVFNAVKTVLIRLTASSPPAKLDMEEFTPDTAITTYQKIAIKIFLLKRDVNAPPAN